MPIKTYKVAQIAPEPSQNDNWWSHVLIAVDGDCWHVDFFRETSLLGFDIGDVVEVPLYQTAHTHPTTGASYMPNWEAVDGRNAAQYNLRDPYAAVKTAWGEENAKKLKFKKTVKFNYTADDFNDSLGMPALRKSEIANHFVSFTEFFRRELLVPLFQPLMKLFDFPSTAPLKSTEDLPAALNAFYDKWCGTAEQRLEFCRHIAQTNPAGEINNSMADLEFAIRNFVIGHCLGKLTKSLNVKSEMAERQVLRELLRKHGVPEDFKTKDFEEESS